MRQQLARELKDANDGFAQAQAQLADVRGRQEQNVVDKKEAQAKIEDVQRKLEEKEGLLAQAVQRLEESDEARQQLLSELKDTSEAYADIKEKMNDIRSRHVRDREEMQKQNSDLKAKLEREIAGSASKDAEVARLWEKCSDVNKYCEEINNLKNALDSARAKNEELSHAVEKEKQRFEEKVAEVRVAFEENKSKLSSALAREAALEEERVKLSETLSDVKQQLKNLKQTLQADRDSYQKERDQWVKVNYELQQKLNAAEKEVAGVKDEEAVATEDRVSAP